MTLDQSLFGDDPDPTRDKPEVADVGIRDWQVDILRKALDSRELTSMADRQALIEQTLRRPVPSLRDLSEVEALSLISNLGSTAPKVQSQSAWDSRDEDTWIDRL